LHLSKNPDPELNKNKTMTVPPLGGFQMIKKAIKTEEQKLEQTCLTKMNMSEIIRVTSVRYVRKTAPCTSKHQTQISFIYTTVKYFCVSWSKLLIFFCF